MAPWLAAWLAGQRRCFLRKKWRIVACSRDLIRLGRATESQVMRSVLSGASGKVSIPVGSRSAVQMFKCISLGVSFQIQHQPRLGHLQWPQRRLCGHCAQLIAPVKISEQIMPHCRCIPAPVSPQCGLTSSPLEHSAEIPSALNGNTKS